MALVDDAVCALRAFAFTCLFVGGCSPVTSGPDASDFGPADADAPRDSGLADDASADAGTQNPDAMVIGSGGVRVVSWNIQRLGAPGTEEYQATLAVLARPDADMVGLNEVDSPDLDNLTAFAARLGFDHVLVPSSNPFGSIRNAILSRLTPVSKGVWTSVELSGDPNANDMTRNPLSMTVVAPNGQTLTLITQHWNSGAGNAEEFLRAVDSFRVGQVADIVVGDVVVMGDLNAEVGDSETPALFTQAPPELGPAGDLLGEDVTTLMATTGLRNDVFAALTIERGLKVLSLAQGDGELATRDASGRRLDYILVPTAVQERTWAGEVYDARDDGLSNFGFAGDAPAEDATAIASDHFPLVADIIP